MAKAKPAEIGPTYRYADDEVPCVVVRKSCGCYVAAHALGDDELDDIRRGKGLTVVDFIREFDGRDVSLEIRPVSFVRKGGLSFDCEHKFIHIEKDDGR